MQEPANYSIGRNHFTYIETAVDPQTLSKYPEGLVSYSFERYVSSEFPPSENEAEVYLDVVLRPYPLHVLSIRKFLADWTEVRHLLIQDKSVVFTWIHKLEQRSSKTPVHEVGKEICSSSVILPARTKVMSMLQLDNKYGNLYYTTYMQFDAACDSNQDQYKQLHEQDKDLLTRYKFERDVRPHIFFMHVLSVHYGQRDMPLENVVVLFDKAFKSEQANDQLPWNDIDVDEYM